MSGEGKGSFFATTGGRYVIIAISALVIWGLTAVMWFSGIGAVSGAVIIICAFFGWQALTAIQPAMFIWMPLIGWVFYILFKFIASALVGFFVAPFVIGKKIGGAIHDSTQQY